MRKHMIYLASGSSRRFGENKLLHEIQGKPMYLYGLQTLQQVTREEPDCDLTVVSRYPAVREMAAAMGIAAVDSPESEKGISCTIRAGLAAIRPLEEADYVLFAVADQPWLSCGSVRRLLQQAEVGVVCASLCWQERPGNPTLFSARLVPELMALTGDTGGRAVLRRHSCTFVPVDEEKELADIDVK